MKKKEYLIKMQYTNYEKEITKSSNICYMSAYENRVEYNNKIQAKVRGKETHKKTSFHDEY